MLESRIVGEAELGVVQHPRSTAARGLDPASLDSFRVVHIPVDMVLDRHGSMTATARTWPMLKAHTIRLYTYSILKQAQGRQSGSKFNAVVPVCSVRLVSLSEKSSSSIGNRSAYLFRDHIRYVWTRPSELL